MVKRSDPREVCFETTASPASLDGTLPACWTWERVRQNGSRTLYKDGEKLVDVVPARLDSTPTLTAP